MPGFSLKAVDFQSTLNNHSLKGKIEVKFASPEVFQYVSKTKKTQDEFLKSLKGLSWCDVYIKDRISLFKPYSWKLLVKNYIYKNSLHKNSKLKNLVSLFLKNDSENHVFLNERNDSPLYFYLLLLKIKSYKTYKRDIAVITFFKNLTNLKIAETKEEKEEIELKFKQETKKLRSYITHEEVERRLEKDGYTRLAIGLYLKIKTKSDFPQLVVDENLYDFDMKNGWSYNQMCQIMSMAFSLHLNKKLEVCHL